uniref:cilia- and flagella-associated protein 54-like n=1 Tax=Styela clava TaxID=7725 RepID=UPI00193A9CC3|nr:cilia- and flagella-associated protein 54-like [Styela clava]
MLALVGGNLVSNALLHAQRANVESKGDLPSATEALKKAASLLSRSEEEEEKLYHLSKSVDVPETPGLSTIPPPPLLLARSNSTMIFKPAPFFPVGTTVAWYRLFGRSSAGPNVKVRLNDYFLEGAGNEVPAGDECIFRVDGLRSNQRYVFAVAAYASDGSLIGNSIGVTSEVIPAHHPMSILNAWSILAEVSHRVGVREVAKQAAEVLWNRFVSPPPESDSDTWTTTDARDFVLTLHSLQKEMISASSQILLRHVVVSMFISVEVAVREQGLFCIKLCDKGPLLPGQILRLQECEKMLVAMELASYLNDASYLLQAVTQCYGLLVPLIQSDVYFIPLIQVLTKCHVALREACGGTRSQRSPMVNNSVHHMIASITYYLSKVLRSFGRPDMCLNMIDAGKQLLNPGEQSQGSLPKVVDSSGEPSSVNVTQGKKRGVKPVSLVNLSMSHELNALEERLAELTKEKHSADELTGGEDASTVLSYIITAKPMLAYKEISKFRRRSRYLEYFVHVMHKALHCGLIEPTIEWSQDVITWLRRRNEGLSVNYTLMSVENGAVVMQGNDPNKYAAVIVSYAQEGSKTKDKKKKTQRKRSRPMVKGNGDEQEELERKALIVLEKHMTELYKNSVKRKKLRKLSFDEMPWRAEFNHLVGLLHLDMLLQKLDRRQQLIKGNVIPSKNISLMDNKLWSLDGCNSIVLQPSTVSHKPFNVKTNIAIEADDDDPGQALLISARNAINVLFDTEQSDEPNAQLSPDDESVRGAESPRTQRTNSPVSMVSTQTIDPNIAAVQNNVIMETFKICMLSFRRGLVLAHRGKHWTLLQNITRSLMSCISVVLEQSVNVHEPVMTMQDFRQLVWFPLTLASDFILDMLVCMQESKSKDWPVDSYAGDIVDEKGGSNLWFDKMMDDSHLYDFPLIKSVILRSIQMLHFECRWEQLVDICLRFTALTHERYSETIAPILIHAQHEILKRVQQYGGESALQLAVNNKGERISFDNHNYVTASLQIQPLDPESASNVNIGGFIDPGAHDVYEGGKRAFALSCVPYDVNSSLWNLHENLKKSRYISRALIHSRKLLGLYLASQYNKKEPRSAQSSAKQDHRGSTVSFVDVESKTQQPFPSGLTHTEFVDNEDVETVPFAHLPTVIESYIKTIELLTSHGERDLVGQANHELGNLYLHTGNNKAALLAWNRGLDQLFGVKNAITQWNKTIEDHYDIPQSMLQKLGPWGSLLAIILTCKIGEFSGVDLQEKTNCALLAAELVQAVFRLSLPHPTSNVDYMSYEIFPQHVLQNNSKPRKYMPGSTSIFPNVDLFSDQYRGEAKQLLSCLHWLCETLVQVQFNLKAFPCICFYQYLATFVCKDLHRSVQCRSIKLTALNNIRAFDVAINDLCVLLYGSKLPHPTDHTYREPDSSPPTINFNLSQSMEALENLKAMEIIASKRLSANLSQLYGPHLTCEITIQQARLLTELSECITGLPQRPTIKDLILVSPEIDAVQLPGGSQRKTPRSQASDDVRSTISALSTASTYRHVKKLFSKRESPMTIPLLKGMLIAVAESLINAMLNPIASSGAKLTSGELWIALHCYLILSQIEQQRQHSTIAASHALKALDLMQSSEVFDDLTVKRPRQIRSALKNRSAERDHRPLTPDAEKQIVNIEQKYRSRLNARLWLQIRLQLCDALLTQIVGLGKVRSPLSNESGSQNHTFLQLYCAKGLVEAEACNDPEMQAAFLLYGSHVEGLSSEETIKTLEDVVATLDELPNLSDQGTVTLVQGTISIADLQLQSNKWTSSHAVQEFHNAHAIMLLHTMHHGETMKHSRLFTSTVEMPFKNIYHRNLQILAHIKLRMGHANYFTLTDTSSVEEWQATTEILRQAKYLCEGSAEKDPRLFAEINFELAKVTRALYFMNGCEVSVVQSALQSAIKSAHISDASVSRDGHLELAMLGITLNTNIQNATSESSNIRSTKQIGMALQTAYSIAEENQSRALLPGNTTVTTTDFTDEDKAKLPDFVLLDLSTSHKDIPAPVTVDDITIDPVVTAARMESGHFTWIHVLHYRILLLRKFSSLRISDEKRPPTAETDDSSIDDFYAGNEKQNDQKSQATKTPMFSKYLSIRVNSLHDYLKEHLPAYGETCELPPFDSKAAVLLVQWYRVRHKMALLWCKTDSQECGKLLIPPSDISRILGQIKALLQKVEIHFGQTMAPVEKNRSRNLRQRKQSTTPQLPSQLEDDVKQTLTNCALLFSPDHDIITSLPFQVTVNSIENMVELFTIGCSYTTTDPLYSWLCELLITSSE